MNDKTSNKALTDAKSGMELLFGEYGQLHQEKCSVNSSESYPDECDCAMERLRAEVYDRYVKPLEEVIEELQRMRVIEQGAWDQTDARNEEIATLQAKVQDLEYALESKDIQRAYEPSQRQVMLQNKIVEMQAKVKELDNIINASKWNSNEWEKKCQSLQARLAEARKG